MTEIEQKALALVNEVAAERDEIPYYDIPRDDFSAAEALCRAIEQHEADKAAHAATVEGILKAHEAFNQDVSDAVEHCRACSDPEAWTRIKFELDRFIIAKPNPLVAALGELADRNMEAEQAAETLREALANRGLKIVETER